MSILTRRRFMDRTGKSVLAALAVGVMSTCSREKQKPNIVFIMADNIGYGIPGCYGQKIIQTPNIDRLTAEGMRFTDCYSGSSLCAPSRACIMTGQHTGHVFRRHNRPYAAIPAEDVTLGEILQTAGYRTGFVGKWGLSNTPGDFDAGTLGLPNDRGFDYWFGFLNQRHAWDYFPEFVWENKEKYHLKDDEYIHELFIERSLQFIDNNRDHPFFLYAGYTNPHADLNHRFSPEAYPVPSDAPYSDMDIPQLEKNFAAMVTLLDRDVGRIMQRLDELGLTHDTIFIFTSDNGPQDVAGHDIELFNDNGNLRDIMSSLYEGGIRIPMVIRWPGRIQAGTVSNQVWAFWDLLPTFADIAGGIIPDDIDGISMLPSWFGQPQEEHDYLYWEVPGRTFLQAVRIGQWKGVRNGTDQPVELYDLSLDISEQNNVAELHPEIVKQIESIFRTARTDSEHWPV